MGLLGSDTVEDVSPAISSYCFKMIQVASSARLKENVPVPHAFEAMVSFMQEGSTSLSVLFYFTFFCSGLFG